MASLSFGNSFVFTQEVSKLERIHQIPRVTFSRASWVPLAVGVCRDWRSGPTADRVIWNTPQVAVWLDSNCLLALILEVHFPLVFNTISQVQDIMTNCQFLTRATQDLALVWLFLPMQIWFSPMQTFRDVYNQSTFRFPGSYLYLYVTRICLCKLQNRRDIFGGGGNYFILPHKYVVRISKKTLTSPLHKLSWNLQITFKLNNIF